MDREKAAGDRSPGGQTMLMPVIPSMQLDDPGQVVTGS